MSVSKVLLEEVYQKVRADGINAMDACMAVCEAWGFRRSQGAAIFREYMEYSMSKQRGFK